MDSEPSAVSIRTATIADAAACVAIYRPLVESTAVSFETVVPTVEEFAARIQKSLSAWTWLIAERDGRCIGYAYGHSHRERAAYRWSVEVTIYVDASHRGQGVGSELYRRLFTDLSNLGYCNSTRTRARPSVSPPAMAATRKAKTSSTSSIATQVPRQRSRTFSPTTCCIARCIWTQPPT